MKRTMTAKHDVEQPKSDEVQSTRLRSIKCIAIAVAVLLIVVLVPIIIIATRKGKSEDQPLWRDVSPEISHLTITHTIITGTRSEVLVVAAKDSTDSGVIELYEYNNGNASWTLQSQLVTGQDGIVASMAVSLHGNRIAICTVSPLRFMVYENINDNNEWKQYGDTMYAMDILADENVTTASYDEMTITTTPAIMLSDDGRIFAISFPTETAEGSVHVLIDVNSLGGTIGSVWKHYGVSIRSSQGMDANFAKHIAMDGAGQKIVVSGDGTLSMYEWNNNNGNESRWELTAEYDESPVPESGSVALSKDGTTTAIGSYKSRDTVDGSGELYILNDVWPWFTYNDENPWFIENAQDGPDYDHQSAGTVQVSLSSKGDYVLVGRQQQSDGNGQLISHLQVHHFDVDNTQWISIGLPFGRVEHETTIISQQIDIADDGTKVAAILLGKVYVYKYIA